METWIFWTAGGIVVISILIYVLFMIFLPEWVGITGKVALDAERSHRGEDDAAENEKGEATAPPSDNPFEKP